MKSCPNLRFGTFAVSNAYLFSMQRDLSRRDILAAGLAGLTLSGCRHLLGVGDVPFRDANLTESAVVGGPNDLMTVRHLKLRGTNEEIGRALAGLARSRHRVRLSKSSQLAARREFYRTSYPAMHDRGRGVARAFGENPDRSELDPFELGYNLDVAPACSTVFYPGSATDSGHAVLSRNYDFSTGTYGEITGRPSPPGARSMTGDPYVIDLRPDQGIPSLYLGSYDLLAGCIDGMNAEGLCVALLANDFEAGQPTRGSRPGVGEIELPLYLLDNCRNVDEARAALEILPVYYSFTGCHYIVGDRKGRSFVFEYAPDLSKRYFVEGKGQTQVVTNHPLHRFEKEPMPGEDPEYGSFSRYRRLQKEIAERGKMSDADIKATNACVMARFTPPGANGRPLGRTLWHSVYDLEARTLEVDFYLGEERGSQRRSGYRKFSL